MHSKWQIWDFFSSFDRGFFARYRGVVAFNTFDPLCLKMVKDFLVRGAEEKVIHHKVSSDITTGWIEEEFQTLSFFNDSDNFFIHHAQDMHPDMLLAFGGLELHGRFVVLSFENEGTLWKKMLKEGKIEAIQVEAPRFWEFNKLLDFVCAHLRLPLSYEAKNWILNSLENNLATFYNSCCLVKLNHPETKEVGVQEVKELLTLERLDQFSMVSLYARKRQVDFFDRLVSLEGDFEKMRSFFNFMQSHLVKLADTSYLSQKPRLSQYDKDLQSCSRLWKVNELIHEVGLFNRWELMCKKKDSLLWHELREAYLRALTTV